jgi:LmbE family N-acetylglucosaminyl deacetylase
VAMRILLCITAHPDDEAGNFGGTLAINAAAGVQIHLVCLTSGEAARNRGAARDNDELALMRRAELARSCELLGVAAHEVWTYPDAGLPSVNFHEVAGRLVKVIRALRPQIVLTMGPEGGMTAHTDHGMAGLLATAAFHWAAREKMFSGCGEPHQAERLFYGSGLRSLPHVQPVLLPPADLKIDIRTHLARKIEAFHAHQTQAPLFERFRAFQEVLSGVEYFHLAAAEPGVNRETLAAAADLWAGLSAT